MDAHRGPGSFAVCGGVHEESEVTDVGHGTKMNTHSFHRKSGYMFLLFYADVSMNDMERFCWEYLDRSNHLSVH